MENTNLKRCSGVKYPENKDRVLVTPHMTDRSNFGKCKDAPDGLKYKCRGCYQAYNNARYAIKPESYERSNNKYRGKNRDKINARNREYYYGNLESVRETSRRYVANNKSKVAANSRRWRIENPEKHRASAQRRRQREAEVHLQDVLITELLERYNSECVYCETPVDIKTGVHEHVVPIINGGLGANFNAVLSCQSCNSSKGGRSYHTWFDTHHDKRKIVLYPDLYLWSAQWEARSLQLQKYRETVKSTEFIETIKANPELLEHEYLKTGLAAKSLQNSL